MIKWLLILSFLPVIGFAKESRLRDWKPLRTFVPEKIDYYGELGAGWEQQSLYWIGGGIGRHLGRCMFSESQTCQQYLDFFGGASGRDGLTALSIHAGPRWQFVKFPAGYSPSIKIFAGVMNIRDDERDLEAFSYGAGYGITTSVHDRIDLRIEARAGYADEFWTQSVVSVHLRVDKWVDYFGNKIKNFGIDAFKKTGRAIHKGFKKSSEVIESIFDEEGARP